DRTREPHPPVHEDQDPVAGPAGARAGDGCEAGTALAPAGARGRLWAGLKARRYNNPSREARRDNGKRETGNGKRETARGWRTAGTPARRAGDSRGKRFVPSTALGCRATGPASLTHQFAKIGARS